MCEEVREVDWLAQHLRSIAFPFFVFNSVFNSSHVGVFYAECGASVQQLWSADEPEWPCVHGTRKWSKWACKWDC